MFLCSAISIFYFIRKLSQHISHIFLSFKEAPAVYLHNTFHNLCVAILSFLFKFSEKIGIKF